MKKEIVSPFIGFFQLENKLNMFDLEFCGVKYWQLIRIWLLKGILLKGTQPINYLEQVSNLKLIFCTFKEALRQKKQLNKLTATDIVRIRPCVTLSNEGKLDDHQYDYVKMEKEYKVLDLYALGRYVSVPNCVEWGLAYPECQLVLWKIRRRLLGVKGIPLEQRNTIQTFLKEINTIYGTTFTVNELQKTIQYNVKSFQLYTRYYENFFRRASPKAIMLYPHYDEHMYSAMFVAKKLNISSIEIQHGRINEHEAYWYEDHRNIGKNLPDYFLVYGRWWKEQIKLPNFTQVIVVGNPYLEAQLEKCTPKNNHIKTVTVFSDPPNGKALSRFVMDCMPYLEQRNIRVVYKMHPKEYAIWQRNYPWLKEGTHLKVIADSTSVYTVINEADVILSMNSTTLFEASVFSDKQILIYDKGNITATLPLVDLGIATIIHDRENFLLQIDSTKNTSQKVKSNIEEELWESHAREKTLNAIYKIVKASSVIN